ncbi:MAG TPA: DinB family protein [Thermoanaerobaculia bacterium]|nr:DinB family protein [Thermoanaerobaculia bacterium]
MFDIPPPATREQLADAVDQVQREAAAYWSSFTTPEFFAKLGDAWSPADNVRHLVKSIRPVVKALRQPKILLRILFGRSRRGSVTYDALRTRYFAALDAGGQAGRFGPSSRSESDLEAWRVEIMEQFAQQNRELRAAIGRWPEKSLDRLQIPHPLLGKLTVREMLFFTIYHQLHHMEVVQRRVAATA